MQRILLGFFEAALGFFSTFTIAYIAVGERSPGFLLIASVSTVLLLATCWKAKLLKPALAGALVALTLLGLVFVLLLGYTG